MVAFEIMHKSKATPKGVGWIFSRDGNGGFFQEAKVFVSEGASSGEISFCYLETKRKTFSTENFIGNMKF